MLLIKPMNFEKRMERAIPIVNIQIEWWGCSYPVMLNACERSKIRFELWERSCLQSACWPTVRLAALARD